MNGFIVPALTYLLDHYQIPDRSLRPVREQSLLFGSLFLNKKYFFLIIPFFLFSFDSCSKKNDDMADRQNMKNEFSWHDNVQLSDIPDFPVKGFLDGNDVTFKYVNLERWRGSNDNVINFSLVVPAQQCGYMDSFIGFAIVNKGNSIGRGDWVKSKFDDEPKTYQAYYFSGGQKSSSPWNCALSIESITENKVTGKIAIFFKDETKSWVAGKFEAIVCNN